MRIPNRNHQTPFPGRQIPFPGRQSPFLSRQTTLTKTNDDDKIENLELQDCSSSSSRNKGKNQNNNHKARPQDDFDDFVNGEWLRKAKIPDSVSSWGPWSILQSQIDDQIRVILDDLNAGNVIEYVEKTDRFSRRKPDHAESLLRVLWRSGLNLDSEDEDTYQKSFLSSFETLKELVAGVNHEKSLASVCGELLKYDLGPVNFSQVQDQSLNDKKERVIFADFVMEGLGLEDPSYYLENNEDMQHIREGYLDLIMQLDNWIPFSSNHKDDKEHHGELNEARMEASARMAEKILYLETELAKAWPSPEILMQNEKTYNPITVRDLKRLYSSRNWSWADWLSSSKFSEQLTDDSVVIIQSPDYFKKLAKLADSVSKETWLTYLRFSLVRKFGKLIRPRFFHQVIEVLMTGQHSCESHYDLLSHFMDDAMGEVLGSLYVKKHFSAQRKSEVLSLINNLKNAFRKRIIKLDWMEQETKDSAIYKLDRLRPLVGYPNKTHDYLDINISEFSEYNMIANYAYCLTYNFDNWRRTIGKAPNPEVWSMHPHKINAYCDFEHNQVVFPAAILQPPFFDPEAETSRNYGAIGAIIGHEITHAFDDQGSKFDAEGRTVDWWTPRDKREFERRTEKIVQQYDGIRMANVAVNGFKTQGENIADLGGLLTAYDALMDVLKHTPEPTGDKKKDYLYEQQQFFISWAYIWRELISTEALRDMILTDCHAPHKLRINIPMSNMPEFYAAFHVKKGDRLFREAADRVHIW
jgi:putative endopeptidase